MKFQIAIVALWVTLFSCGYIKANHVERGEEELIAQILRLDSGDGKYTVLAPDTGLGLGILNDKNLIELNKTGIKKSLKIPGYDPSDLVDALFAYNAKSTRLSLPSSIADGYVVDRDRKYERYFKKNGGGWERLRKENPKAQGHTTVSIPVIDKEHNIVLIYIGAQKDWLEGVGYVIAYRNENGKLLDLGRVQLWAS